MLENDELVALMPSEQDSTLKRCFGINKKVADCNWSYLREMRTLQEPRDVMLRLSDLLVYLASPGLEQIWLLLDIKVLVSLRVLAIILMRRKCKGR